jgi:hypothetical protein
VNRDRLKELANEERFITGIYNYCDRWCERCPQTSRCLNFSISEEKFRDSETHDIQNEAFWRKLSELFRETLELLQETGKKWGIDLKTLDLEKAEENIAAKKEAAVNHVVYRAAESYGRIVDDWFRENGAFFSFGTIAVAGAEVAIEEALEVIRWYQYFIAAKVMRAIRGKAEDEGEEGDEFPRDPDGSAKVALIAIDRSIGAWGVIPQYNRFYAEGVFEVVSLLKLLRQAIEETFPRARAFIRPGFDSLDLNGQEVPPTPPII